MGADDAHKCSRGTSRKLVSYVDFLGRDHLWTCRKKPRLHIVKIQIVRRDADPKTYLQTLCFDLGVFAQKNKQRKRHDDADATGKNWFTSLAVWLYFYNGPSPGDVPRL